MKRLSETYKLTITPLMPIHVGSGEEISPGEYFVFPEDYTLYVTDVGYMASRLKEKPRTKILDWISQDPIKWVSEMTSVDSLAELIRKYSRFQCELAKNVHAEIRKRWGTNDSMLTVRTLQRAFHSPIIPGSSIKGAIRTALVYTNAPKPLERFPVEQFQVAGWEREQLGGASNKIEHDPLRHLSVADACAKDVQTVVYQPEFYGMQSGSAGSAELPIFCECFPETFDDENPYHLETTLSIAVGHPSYRHNAARITRDFILKACRQFYEAVIDAETEYWTKVRDNKIIDYYNKWLKVVCADRNAALIRLGWGSGMNAVGLNLAKPRSTHGRNLDVHYRHDPKTRRLLGGLPAGWAEIRLENC